MRNVNDFPSWPHFDFDEREAVEQVLASGKVNYWTGSSGREFEKDYASYTGRKHAIALHNGTLALELALYAFEIGQGDEVITTPRTFMASASAAVMRGAVPVFADVDRDTQNITAATIKPVITPRTRAIIVVHLGGWPCAMDEIMLLASKHNLIVIEDCAQAHGAKWKGRAVGAFGHAAAFSFCQDKIITTGGEGGMLVLDDEVAWSRAWSFKDHGKSYDAVYNRPHPPGFRWVHESFGTNWRMLEVQAAIGRIQLRKLNDWVTVRTRNAEVLRDELADLSVFRTPWPRGAVEHAFYRFYTFVEPAALKAGWSRDRIMTEISAHGVPCGVGSCSEIYLEKAFTLNDFGVRERLPVARELGESSLAFVVHPTLRETDMQKIVELIRYVAQEASV